MTTVNSLNPPVPVKPKILGYPVATIKAVREALNAERYYPNSMDDTDLMFAVDILDSLLSSGGSDDSC